MGIQVDWFDENEHGIYNFGKFDLSESNWSITVLGDS